MELITTTNTKLGGHIAQINMPYIVSCREDAPCINQCYCKKGPIGMTTARTSHMKKLCAYKADPKGFFDQINLELKFVPYKYFRWHSSGDIVDEQYLDYMFKLARKNKQTRFLCFTKKYEMVNEYLNSHKKPNNLIICLSHWKDWHPDNPHNLPTSYVDFGGTLDIPQFAYECTDSCGDCPGTHCWHMKNGDSVVFKKH